MKNPRSLFQTALRSSLSAASFWITLAGLAYAYAALSPLPNVQTNDQLSASAWNAMVTNVNSLASSGGVPTGGVMAFFGTSCPTGWSAADGTANGVKKTDGTSGTLDLRGEFVRGLDGGRGVDAGRALASGQTDAFKSHHHGLSLDGNAWTAFLRFGSPNATWWMSNAWANHFFTDSTGGWETRPRNVALLYCVKS